MPDAFDMLGDPVTTDKGTIYDYDASLGEAFGAGFDRQMDTNPLALIARQARFFSEDMGSLAGIGERVDQKTAEEEVRRRGLDLKIPKGGITRYELDTLQYLKQREIAQNTVGARARGITGAAAGFAGGVAGSFTDPINIASNFIPFVSEARYASWLARAGASTLARAGVRAGAGAIEGAAGAAVLEPLVYAGATSQQLDYTSTDSFMNVVFGGVMGGGLHPIGGAVYDARVSRALRGLDPGILAMRDAVANAPDHVKRDLLQTAVAQTERGEAVDVMPHLDAWHGSPHTFDRFQMAKMGTGQGAQTYGDGLYFAQNEVVAQRYLEDLQSDRPGALYKVKLNLKPDELLDWDKPVTDFPRVAETVKQYAELFMDGSSAAQRNASKDAMLALKSGNMTGEGALRSLVRILGGDNAAAANALRQDAGLKGIRYKDQGSRGKDGGTYNFVVFDDKNVEIVTRNGEPIAKPQSTPRDLGGLIEQAKADRSEAAFNRQFGDEADEATSRAADEAVAAKDLTPEDIAGETDMFNAHLDSMRERGLVDEDMEAELKAADEAADKMEAEAQAYEAAAVCELGA